MTATLAELINAIIRLTEDNPNHAPDTGQFASGGGGGSGKSKSKPSGQKAGSTPKSGGATTVEDYHGAKIETPVNLNVKKQSMTAQDIKSAIDQIPAEYRTAISKIALSDKPYTDSAGRSDKNFAATYYSDTGTIEIHSTDSLSNLEPEQVKKVMSGVIRHETAHALTDKLPPAFVKDWQKAAKQDGGSITDYAKTDTHEDIAETIAAYWSPDKYDRASVDRFFPARAAILKKYNIKAGG